VRSSDGGLDPAERGADGGGALEFRRVSHETAGPLAAFFAALMESGDERFFHPHPLTAAHAHALASYAGRDLYYVALDGGRVLAYGLLRGWDEGYAVPSLGIAIHPESRGSGLARPFMHFLHAAAARRAAPRVRLKVYRENARALALYTALGYDFGGSDATGAGAGEIVGTLAL
jgi:ribosomal protein S18 acetylase RimI-like enzyme